MMRRDEPGVSPALVAFAHAAVLMFLAAVPYQPPWWIALSGVVLIGTGLLAFRDSHRYRRKSSERGRRSGPP